MSRPPITIVFRARDGVLALPNAWHLLNLAPEDYVILPTTATAVEVERAVTPLVARTPGAPHPHGPDHSKLGRVIKTPATPRPRGPNKDHGPDWKPTPREVDKLVTTQAGRFLHIAISLNAPFTVNDIYPHMMPIDHIKSVSPAFTIMQRQKLIERIGKKNNSFTYIVTQFGRDKYAEFDHACYTRYNLEVPTITPLIKEPLNA